MLKLSEKGVARCENRWFDGMKMTISKNLMRIECLREKFMALARRLKIYDQLRMLPISRWIGISDFWNRNSSSSKASGKLPVNVPAVLEQSEVDVQVQVRNPDLNVSNRMTHFD